MIVHMGHLLLLQEQVIHLSKVGGCDLVLNCGQMQAEDTYKPDLENNVWFKPSWGGDVTWNSITLTHTSECDECKALH